MMKANMLRRAKIKINALIFVEDLIHHLVFLSLLLYFAYPTENASGFQYSQFPEEKLLSKNFSHPSFVTKHDLVSHGSISSSAQLAEVMPTEPAPC